MTTKQKGLLTRISALSHSLSNKQQQQLEELLQRCLLAEDLEVLKYELYCYDPVKYYYFSPVAEPQMHISMFDIASVFKPLYEKYEQSLNNNKNHKEKI